MISCVYAGCTGPGLEPPENSGVGPGGVGAGTGGVGGSAGTAGTAGAMSGTGGFGNAGSSGSAGTGVTGGAGGMSAGGTGGAGGVAGMGGVGGTGAGGTGGESGASTDPDAGALDGGAEMMECEEGREEVEVSVFNSPEPHCLVPATVQALLYDGNFSVAITMADGTETKWPSRKDMGDDCAEDEAFVVNNALDVPRIELCPALCQAVADALASGVTVELIYGCPPPP